MFSNLISVSIYLSMEDLYYVRVELETAIRKRSEGLFEKMEFENDLDNNSLKFICILVGDPRPIHQDYDLKQWQTLLQTNRFYIELDKNLEWFNRRNQNIR